MQVLREDVLTAVYAAIDEVNSQSNGGSPVDKTPETYLFAGDRGVDSLTLVNLVVAVEEQIHTSFGKSVVLVDEDSMDLQENPFRTVGSLATYVERVLDKQ
jgi:acyl carrier protein